MVTCCSLSCSQISLALLLYEGAQDTQVKQDTGAGSTNQSEDRDPKGQFKGQGQEQDTGSGSQVSDIAQVISGKVEGSRIRGELCLLSRSAYRGVASETASTPSLAQHVPFICLFC